MRTTPKLAAALLAAAAAWGCQSPTEADDTSTEEFVVTSLSPDPVTAAGPTGRFYTFVPTNSQPNEQREYDWRSSFRLGVSLNSHATDDDVNLEFPVKITTATVRVQQASGGIITPPTGSDQEHYEADFRATSNTMSAVDQAVSLDFDVWYDLPNLRREALVTVALTFTDNESRSFSRAVEVRIAP
jgi:hypothetical protein